jgi:hypothetical protein
VGLKTLLCDPPRLAPHRIGFNPTSRATTRNPKLATMKMSTRVDDDDLVF